MSYDAFPPDSSPSPEQEEDRTNAAQETSSAGAPPAKSPRRRRAKNAGTDAASAPEVTDVVAEKPARAPTSRRKAQTSQSTSQEPSQPEEPSASITETSAPTEAETPPKASARRRSSARRKAQADPDASVTDAPDAPQTAASSEKTVSPETPEAEPPKTTRRSRKSATTPPQAARTVPTTETPVTAEADVTTPAPTEPEAAAEPKTSRRSRSSRSRQKTEPEAAETSQADETETGKVSSASAETLAVSVPPPGKPARRSRSRKPEKEAESPSKETAPASTPVAETASASETETREGAGRRRAGRSRKKPVQETDVAQSIQAETAVEAGATDAVTETAELETSAPAARARRSRGRERGRARRERGDRTETPETIPAPAEPEEEKVDRTVGAHLITRQGVPEIHINGVPYPPVLFFGYMEDEKSRQRVLSEARRAARNGVHLHSTLIELPCPLSENSNALDEIDNRLRALLDADPEGFLMPRIVFVPARGWKREYPTDIATYADGTTSDPSITSERFWLEAEHSLATMIAHIQQQEWGARLFGYHLERGEWFQPADQGYDRSIANRDAFRDWLREKYRHNLVALRAAWYDGDVQFHTAEIPPIVAKPNPTRAFYETRRERRVIDFNEFTSETTAKRLVSLARTVKKATGNQALVSVCYGYTFEFGHGFSGHLALGQLLTSNAINLLCGPPSYRDRKPGGAASYPAPVDSPALHGKLWLSEDDTKTHLAPAQQDPEDFNPRFGDRFLTEQAQYRAMGSALAHHAAIGFMDLWGEGWLDDDTLWERLGAFTARYAAALNQHERPRGSEVVALIDEKSLLHIQRGEPFFRKMTNGLRETLQRAGVSYSLYLQSDLLSARFPTDAKLYLFLTPFRLTTEQRQAIREKLHTGGKTLAWLYAPGACEEHPGVGGAMEESAAPVVGMALRPQEWNSEVGSRILRQEHPVTEKMPGREYGIRERLNPSFYVDDPQVTVLAEYQGSGLPSLAVKDLRDWKSVFVGDPVLPLELLKGICRYAGVHLWMPQSEDVVAVGDGWVMIHGSRDGHRTLSLPSPTGLYDVTERRLIAEEIREYRFFLRAGMTRLFCVGSVEQMQRYHLPNLNLPGEVSIRPKPEESSVNTRRRRSEARRRPLASREPAEKPTEEPEAAITDLEPEEAAPKEPNLELVEAQPTSADLETLQAVLSMDISAYEDVVFEETEDLVVGLPRSREHAEGAGSLTDLLGDSEPGGLRRRRRRRGGRGRGRRQGGETDSAGNADTNSATDRGPELPPPSED